MLSSTDPGHAATMIAVVTTGNGGYDKLVYQAVPMPRLVPGEVLVQVLAAGINNTEINTRLGWYSQGGWSMPTPFPFIQGTDCCGRVVAVAPGESDAMVGRRVLVRPCTRPHGFSSPDTIWMGCDFDGAFAQFVAVRATEVFAVDCGWSDVELGSIPCASGTAENMVHRVAVTVGDHVLVAGASGGVGSAAVQLAKRRGATVTAIAATAKHAQILAIGADRVVDRNDDVIALLGTSSVDVVIDNVAGPSFGALLSVLKRGGRYVSSGAIAGPIVSLDMRTMYLNDLTLFGCTAWDEPVFSNLVSYIEHGEIRPLVARTFPLSEIAFAQREFLEKRHVGNFVLVPPAG